MVDADAMLERQRLYDEGLNDAQIAARVGRTAATIQAWRRVRGLAQQYTLADRTPGSFRHKREATAARVAEKFKLRMSLYRQGLDDDEIAEATGFSRKSVEKWRGVNKLPCVPSVATRKSARRKPQKRRRDVAITPSSNPIYSRIKAAVGRGLPSDICDDVISEIWLALAEGRLNGAELGKEAGRYRNRYLNEYADSKGQRSLDEVIGENGFRMIDMLRDDRSRDWLETMGATVW